MKHCDPSPEEIVAILLETAEVASDFRRNQILKRVQNHLLAIGKYEFPSLESDLQDAVQQSLLVISCRERLESLMERHRFWGWSRGVFVNTALDLLRRRRRDCFRLSPRAYGQDSNDWFARLLTNAIETPEMLVQRREILRRVLVEIKRSEIGRLRFLLDWDEENIGARLGLTRDQVAGRLKRLRAKLRRLLGGDAEPIRTSRKRATTQTAR